MDAIESRVKAAISDYVFPGCVIGVIKEGKRDVAAFGRHGYSSDTPLVTENALYDCASLTKVVPTVTIALQLIDEGRLSLDDAFTTFIPEYRTRHASDVRIRHLMVYTLGNTTPLSSLVGKSTKEFFEAIYTEDTQAPDTVFSYSNTPAFLLGIVIERILNQQLDIAAHERIFTPLRMQATTFAPRNAVPTEEGIVNVVHDESARLLARPSGHAGLFSTVPDLLNFLEHILDQEDERLVTNHVAHLQGSAALGWELNQSFMGASRTERTFGKTGFTGTCIVANFERNTALVMLSNRTYPKRPNDALAINTFRASLCDIVFS